MLLDYWMGQSEADLLLLSELFFGEIHDGFEMTQKK